MEQKNQRFDALHVALELIRSVQPLIGAIRSRDRQLADQVQRSCQSVCLNLSEGRRRTGKDRRHLFAVAVGSNSETRTALHLAIACGYVRDADTQTALEYADRLAAMTWRLSH